MDFAIVVRDVLFMLGATVLLMVLLGALSRRLLGVRTSAGRIILAGVLGLGAGVGFESRFVWQADEYTPAMLPILFGIIVLVAVAVLVIAELWIPQGSIPRPDQWPELIRRTVARNRRYAQLARILARHRVTGLPRTLAGGPGASRELRAQATAVKLALEEAGGAFVKLGQLLSTRPDVLPAEFLEALSTLQQDVPPAAWDTIEPELERALGAPVDEVFASFARTPFAAASIGQVYDATLPSGERVAVKVRRPGIVELIERDVDIAQRLAQRLARSTTWAQQFGLEPLVAGLTDSLREELDYTREAENMTALRVTQEEIPPAARVRVPHHHPDVSSDSVLVMEFVSGPTVSDATALRALSPTVRREHARRLLAAILAQILETGVFHADLHPGNILLTDAGVTLLDFGSVGRIDSQTRAQLNDVLFAFSRSDATGFTEGLLGFVDLSEVDNEYRLRQSVATFMASRLGPGSRLDAAMFSEVVAILADHGISVPPELTVPIRALTTAEGSLRALDPTFDLVAEAEDYATARLRNAARPTSVAQAVQQEFLSAIPLVKRLPQRVDRLTASLADGRFTMNMRMLADRRDRGFLREIIGLAVVTFLAGIFGIMAAMLLTSTAGPQLTDTLTLFQVFGYLFLLVSGVLTLRALFDVLRRRPQRH